MIGVKILLRLSSSRRLTLLRSVMSGLADWTVELSRAQPGSRGGLSLSELSRVRVPRLVQQW